MKKLKTLKDLAGVPFALIKGEEIVYKKELKVEAIKCAKYFLKIMNKIENSDFEYGEPEPSNFSYWKGRFDEVMERNNLTEEDLK